MVPHFLLSPVLDQPEQCHDAFRADGDQHPYLARSAAEAEALSRPRPSQHPQAPASKRSTMARTLSAEMPAPAFRALSP